MADKDVAHVTKTEEKKPSEVELLTKRIDELEKKVELILKQVNINDKPVNPFSEGPKVKDRIPIR